MKPLPNRQTLLRYGPAAVISVVITALSLAPAYLFHGVESSLPPIKNLDKIVHALMYATLTAAYLHATPYPERSRLSVVLRIALLASVFGIVMELCQKWLTTTRTMEVLDALANAAGAFACALLAYAWSRHQAGNGRTNHAGH